ncbi:MAG: T9SS C-terminal target domain-containing protein [Bacteroidetes bacterium]|nr:MAG: T9SS C-terminal target domain-containing protein [Bacteroidota bacterium]
MIQHLLLAKKQASVLYYKMLFCCCLLLLQFSPLFTRAQTKPVLFFVSHENCYYSEYIVMLKALQAAGYTVDVRSASNDSAATYMIPANTDIAATAATLPGGSYLQFTQLFQQLFDSTWSAAWNATPLYIPVNGKIQDVVNMSNYSALVIAGGTGVSAYRVTGSYSSQGLGARFLSASTVQAASLKLNQLAIEALQQGKPVLGQCHGASLPAYWRIPSTSGPGIDSIGYSLLRGGYATGFPEPQTSTTLSNLSINYRSDDRVTISNPHPSLNHQDNGNGKVLTSRDWYPQTVAHAARALINVMQTFPTNAVMQAPVSVLILHGGVVDSLNCGPNNKINDVPCNHGTGANLPADYRHIQTLLNANSPNDSFLFNVTQLNLSAPSLPYQANNTNAILSYLQGYDVVIFFKHWSTDVTSQLQNALVQYVDGGGGLLALHHGLYNDSINVSFNKNILRSQLFGAESSSNNWSGVNLSNYQLYQTNYGHFISSYGITPSLSLSTPAAWNLSPLVNSANTNHSVFHGFNIYDETYNNLAFTSGQQFGRKVNQITPLFSNSVTPGNQMHVAGYTKLVNLSADTTVGRLVYLQPGERRETIHINHRFGQVIRNAITWLANNSSITTVPVKMLEPTILCENGWTTLNWTTTVEINNSHFVIQASNDGVNWQQVEKIKGAGQQKTMKQYTCKINAPHPFYRINQVDWGGTVHYGNTMVADCFSAQPSDELLVYPNPSVGLIELIPRNNLVQEAQVNIYRMDGTLVLSKTITSSDDKKYEVDAGLLTTGVYFLEFIQGQNVMHQRVMINK